MKPIFTQCPNCKTPYKMSKEQLNAAQGVVRCGTCAEVFIAAKNTLNYKKSIFSVLKRIAFNRPKKNKKPTKAALRESLSNLQNDDSLEVLEEALVDQLGDSPVEIAPIEIGRSFAMSALLFSLNLILLLALASQYIWYNLDEVLQNPRLRFATDIICETLNCPTPPLADLSLLATQDLTIRSHPLYEEALKVDFTFSNLAEFDQNFPLAELIFTDASNQAIASRQFKPNEYLPSDLSPFSRMPALSSIQISLEIMDPGAKALNYSLSFK